MHVDGDRVSLQAMSSDQQRLVETHLPLVHLTMRRCNELSRIHRPGREPSELLQEGCLALAEAVRSHDPTRHGRFATFAMARIHYAMSRYAHEQHSLIRIPYITQRRRKKSRTEGNGDRHHPFPLPRVVQMNDRRKTPSQHMASRRYAEGMGGGSEGVTIGDLLRECYDRVASLVVTRMKREPRQSTGLRELLDQCHRERWSVPEPDARMPIRRVASTLGCSIGRVTHCEERFRRRVAAVLKADAAYQSLLRLGRRRAEGWRHRLSPDEMADVSRPQSGGAGVRATPLPGATSERPEASRATRPFPRRSSSDSQAGSWA